MKSNQFLFLLFLWLLIFSCKKDDAIKFTYYKSGLKTAGDLRVFSSNGEITDFSLISRFSDKDSSTFSIEAGNIINFPGTMDSIQLSDAQHAIVKDKFF